MPSTAVASLPITCGSSVSSSAATTVFSPGRVLDPTSEVKAWIDGTEVAGIAEDGRFGAKVKLHVGDDQIHVRATDLTKREGRGYVGTWIPGVVAPVVEEPAEEAPRTQRILDSIVVKRMGTPEDVARAALFFLSPDNGFVTGQVLYVCGGTTLGLAPV